MEFINRNPKIIIISGKASSGKSLSANIIKDNTNNTILLAYADYLKMYAKNISGWDGSEDTKPRELLQQLGVELIKNNINENMLINRIIEDIKVYSYFYDYIVITDARFPNEIESIKKEFDNVISVRINRNIYNLDKKYQNHSTETGMDEYNNYDYVIDNNSDLKALEIKVMEVVKNA
jgi:dephospho-CoA kinase